MKVKNNLSFQGELNEIESYNSSFMRTKCKIFAFGKNRNASDITRASFEKAKKSLAFIPMVAKFSDKEDMHGLDGDLEGHNTYLDRDKDGNWVIKNDTFPIGVVSPNANITFEEINEGTEFEPIYKTYVTVDEIFLWKRYEATQKIEDWLSKGISPKVSMEINNVEGSFDDDNYFKIDSFEFEAIAALGSDIEPCFPMAQIESYSLIDIKKEFEKMLNELKFTLSKGGTEMENFEQTTETVEENVQTEEVFEQIVTEETAEETTEFENTEQSETTEESVEKVVETTDTEDVEEVEQVEETDYQVKFEELEKEFNTLKENYSSLEAEITQLREFKSTKLAEERSKAESEIFSRFTTELTETEIEEVKSVAHEFTLEQLEEKLFTLVGKKKAKFSVQEDKKSLKVNLDFNKDDEQPNPYGDLFSKYAAKE